MRDLQAFVVPKFKSLLAQNSIFARDKYYSMRMKWFGFLIFLGSVLQAQNFPKDYFGSPVLIPIQLSGTFGELRSNHFHSGIDIKTQGVTGLPVLATAEGYVSRIRVSPRGFGNAIYINHPNGFTTVYGHMERFSPEISAFVKAEQYRQKSFEVDLYLSPEQFTFSKGDEIGKSGNSGSSGGPHVHFEIRDTKTEEPLNPLLFGFNMPDNRAPELYKLLIIPLDGDARINGKRKVHTMTLTKVKEGVFKTSGEDVLIGGKVGFAIEAYDKHTGQENRNGVYSVKLSFEGRPVFEQKMDRFSFDETRYLNACITYDQMQCCNVKALKTYVDPGNKLAMLKGQPPGILINERRNFLISIEVADVAGNKSTVNFNFWGEFNFASRTLEGTDPATLRKDLFPHNRINKYQKNDIDIYIPEGVFYRDIFFKYSVDSTANGRYYSHKHKVHETSEPVHKHYALSLRAVNFPEKHQSKLCLVEVGSNAPSYIGGEFKDNFVTAQVRQFGTFAVMADTTAPRLKANDLVEGKNIGNQRSFNFTVSDNLSGIKKYNAYLNGEWILLEYDAKSNLMHYKVDERVKGGKNTIRLVVSDDKDNETELSINFVK